MKNKLLDQVNVAYANLDELFYHMEDNYYTDNVCEVLISHLQDINSMLSKINSLNKF